MRLLRDDFAAGLIGADVASLNRRIMSTAATASNAQNAPEDWSLSDAVALRAKVEGNHASPAEQEMWRRLRNRFEAKYRRGSLSDRSARQLGLIR